MSSERRLQGQKSEHWYKERRVESQGKAKRNAWRRVDLDLVRMEDEVRQFRLGHICVPTMKPMLLH